MVRVTDLEPASSRHNSSKRRRWGRVQEEEEDVEDSETKNRQSTIRKQAGKGKGKAVKTEEAEEASGATRRSSRKSSEKATAAIRGEVTGSAVPKPKGASPSSDSFVADDSNVEDQASAASSSSLDESLTAPSLTRQTTKRRRSSGRANESELPLPKRRRQRTECTEDEDYQPSQSRAKPSHRKAGLSRSRAYADLSEEDDQDSQRSASTGSTENPSDDAFVDWVKMIAEMEGSGQLQYTEATSASHATSGSGQLNGFKGASKAASTAKRAATASKKSTRALSEDSSSPSSSSNDSDIQRNLRPAGSNKPSRFLAKRTMKTGKQRRAPTSKPAKPNLPATAPGPSALKRRQAPDQSQQPEESSSERSSSSGEGRKDAFSSTSTEIRSSESDYAPVARRTRLGGCRKLPVRFITPELEDQHSACSFDDEDRDIEEANPPADDLERPPDGQVWIYTAASQRSIALIAFDRQARSEPAEFSTQFGTDQLRSLEALRSCLDLWSKEWMRNQSHVTLYTSEPRLITAADGICKDKALQEAFDVCLRCKIDELQKQGVEVNVDYLVKDKNRRAHDFANGLLDLNS